MSDVNRKKISNQTRNEVYKKYDGHCAYCGCEIKITEMQIDHLNSIYRNRQDNTESGNLMPSCKQCNFYKSTFTLEQFRARLLNTLMPNVRKTFQFRLAEKYGLLKDNNKKSVKFYFEQTEK